MSEVCGKEESEAELRIEQIKVLRGPNIWAHFPVMEAWVSLGRLHDVSSADLPGFAARFKTAFPSMLEHRCSPGVRGGFFQRLDEGTYPAHILEHLTLELQCLAGSQVGFGKARETSTPGLYRVVFRYREEDFARECFRTARNLLLAIYQGQEVNAAPEIERLKDLYQEVSLGPSTSAIVSAARARNIPVRRLNKYSLVQLGYGCKARRIQAAETDTTSSIAEGIAQDKELTRRLLRAAGVPVPEGQIVKGPAEAWAVAQEIGLPVVIKPSDGNQGRGVATNLSSRAEVEAAFEIAKNHGEAVMAERFIPGGDYRLLVIAGKLVAAARREPASVTGDGRLTVAELVEQANQDPRRGEHHATILSRIKIDDVALEVLKSQGLSAQSIPALGLKVLIRRNANLSTGGTAVDVTELVHSELAKRAVEAARMVGLDIAGVDVVCPDISRPLEESGGAVVEVNAAPGLRMHLEPSEGQPRAVGEAIVESLFAPGENGRIPIVAVSGVNGKTTTTRCVAHILSGAGYNVGMTTTDGVFVGQRKIDSGDCSGPQSAGRLLMNPAVEAGVFETARGGVLREGLAFNECDVAIVTNIGQGDHLGLGEIQTVEDLAQVKRCIVEVVGQHGYAVLNAADPLVAAMSECCAGGVIYFALSESTPVLREHLKKGGRGAFVRNAELTLSEKGQTLFSMPLAAIPITNGGLVSFHVENMLASAAAAWGLGVPFDLCRKQLESFSADVSATRGRFSVIEINQATVVVDYGHNIDALGAVVKTLEHYPQKYRSAVYAVAGDRRDADIIAQGEILSSAFDRVFLYEDESFLRGRPQGESFKLLRQGLANHGRPRTSSIEEVNGSVNACKLAVSKLQPGELLLMQIDAIDETIDWLTSQR